MNNKFKKIFIMCFVVLLGNLFYIAEDSNNDICVFDRAIAFNDNNNCLRGNNFLRNQFKLYQLNKDENILIKYFHYYEGQKENKNITDDVDNNNFYNLTKYYILNYKSSKKYNDVINQLDYIYKNYLPDKYLLFKKLIKENT